MSKSHIIYENSATQEKLEVTGPLRSLVNVEELRQDIGLPDYIDLHDFQIRKIVVALWAFRYPSALIPGATKEPLKVALFGGGAFKLYCPSANRGPFSRKIGDVDFVTSKASGALVLKILCGLSEKFGGLFFHATSASDRRFNTLRARKRYRVHTIKDIDENGLPIPGLMDIFCDKLPFCHTLDVRDELRETENHNFTIGLENMIISKAQLIKRVPKDKSANVDQNRTLGEHGKNYFLIGMETKDMRDVAAALLDHELGEGKDRINIEIMGRKLRQDWGLWKTVTKNLRNMQNRLEAITEVFDAEKKQQEIIGDRLEKIVEQLEGKYAVRKGPLAFSQQWWEEVEEQAT